MAKTKKSDEFNPAGLFVLLAFSTTLLACVAIVFGPMLLFVLWFVNKQDKKYFVEKVIAGKTEVGSLTEEESALLEKAENRYNSFIRARDQIDALGGDLTRKDNGYFYNNSKLGKQLNPKLHMVNQMIENASNEARQLRELPERRNASMIKLYTMGTAVKTGLIAYPVTMILAWLIWKNIVVSSIAAVVVTVSLMFLVLSDAYFGSSKKRTYKSKVFDRH